MLWIGCMVLGLSVGFPPGAGAGTVRPLEPLLDGSVRAEDFVLKDLDGRTVRFSRFRGNVVLLNFWATWCTSCLQELPALERLYRRYRARGFVVVAVSLDRAPASAVRTFVKELGLSFPVLHDPDQATGRLYGAWGVPFSFLIDARGRIAYRIPGEYDWDAQEARAAVEALLEKAGRSAGGKPGGET